VRLLVDRHSLRSGVGSPRLLPISQNVDPM